MRQNVGGTDRSVRLILGAVLVALPIVIEFPGYWDALPFAIGAVLLLTALFRYCPINQALGFDSRRGNAAGSTGRDDEGDRHARTR